MRKRSRIIISLVALAIPLIVLILILSRDPEKSAVPQTLPDGSTIALTGVKTGTNAVFIHGTFWEKLRYQFLPTNGLRIAGRSFKPPPIDVIRAKSKSPCLFVEFKFEGFTNNQNPLVTAALVARMPPGTRISANGEMDLFCNMPAECFRVIVAGNEGSEFANPFLAFRSNAYFTISFPFYPRQSKDLKIRFERRNLPSSPWQTVAQFTAHATPEPERIWKAEPLPAKRMLGTNEFILSEVSAIPSGTFAEDFGKYAARFDFHISGTNGRSMRVAKFKLQDAGGNQLTPDRKLYWDVDSGQNFRARIYPAPNPRKIWRISAEIRTLEPAPATNTVEFFVKPTQKTLSP